MTTTSDHMTYTVSVERTRTKDLHCARCRAPRAVITAHADAIGSTCGRCAAGDRPIPGVACGDCSALQWEGPDSYLCAGCAEQAAPGVIGCADTLEVARTAYAAFRQRDDQDGMAMAENAAVSAYRGVRSRSVAVLVAAGHDPQRAAAAVAASDRLVVWAEASAPRYVC